MQGVCFCEPVIHLYIEAWREAQQTRVLCASDEDDFICSLARSLIGFDNQSWLIQFVAPDDRNRRRGENDIQSSFQVCYNLLVEKYLIKKI